MGAVVRCSTAVFKLAVVRGFSLKNTAISQSSGTSVGNPHSSPFSVRTALTLTARWATGPKAAHALVVLRGVYSGTEAEL